MWQSTSHHKSLNGNPTDATIEKSVAPVPKVGDGAGGNGYRLRLLIAAGVLSGLSLHPTDVFADGGHILRVGFGEAFSVPSAAATAAKAGDIVEIAPGTYEDCAVWPAQAGSITIRAEKNGLVAITGKVCEYKALFVVKGDNVTVRGIRFSGAKSILHNAAGIRAEGRNLTVEDAEFLDNEEGILAPSLPGSSMTVRNSRFTGNGNCIVPSGCAHGLYVNNIDRLVVEGCTFIDQHVGHDVKSRAARTELMDNTIEDGPTGSASYLVDIPNGGALVMRRNILEKGQHSENGMAAIILGEEGNTNNTPEILIEDNRFANDFPQQTVFVRNLTGTAPTMRRNDFKGLIKPLDESQN